MVKARFIDPLKVITTALVDASSISSLMTTTEAVVIEHPKDDKGMPIGGGNELYGSRVSAKISGPGTVHGLTHHIYNPGAASLDEISFVVEFSFVVASLDLFGSFWFVWICNSGFEFVWMLLNPVLQFLICLVTGLHL
ncbi:hypothetical protein AgCh_003220 [Apium graveolens]